MVKTCKHCESVKDESCFYKFFDKWSSKHYLSARCKPCHQEYRRVSKSNSRNRKAEKLQLRYGLTYEQWEDMRSAEDYRCMICGISEEEIDKRLDVDHCHDSGKVRGILCNPCNNILGHAKDNLAVLESAVRYLKNYGGGYK